MHVIKDLIAYCKSSSDFTWVAVRNNVLGKHYHEEMSLEDVMFVLHGLYEKICSDTEYKIAFKPYHLIMAPAKTRDFGVFGPTKETTMTLEQMYNYMVEFICYELRFTKVRQPVLVEGKEVHVGDTLYESGLEFVIINIATSFSGTIGLYGRGINGYNRFRILPYWSWNKQRESRTD